jgi:AmiR/NasT family two-component response regulator
MTAASTAGHAQLVAKVRPNRILVADDEHLIATDVAMTLAELGYTVVGPATDGVAAIEMAQFAAPDMALLDIQMPRCDGLSAARRIFEDFEVPVIVLSAYSDEEYIDSARAAGVFGYLVKPATASQLRAAIDIAWGRYCRAIEARDAIEALERKLEDRRIIERAKWILVQRKQLSEEEAQRALQRQARQSRRKIVEIAQQIVDASELL